MNTAEIHIAGAIVHVAPKRMAQAIAAIAQVADVEIRATDPRGKLVVVVEADSGAAILARLDTIQRIDGVLSALLVYQHAESAQSMNEEVIDEGVAT
jgi:nitrate reductase NapD